VIFRKPISCAEPCGQKKRAFKSPTRMHDLGTCWLGHSPFMCRAERPRKAQKKPNIGQSLGVDGMNNSILTDLRVLITTKGNRNFEARPTSPHVSSWTYPRWLSQRSSCSYTIFVVSSTAFVNIFLYGVIAPGTPRSKLPSEPRHLCEIWQGCRITPT
jgi:hypothetical protein